MKEKEIENNILEYLSYLPDCKYWKNQSAGIYDSARGTYRKSFNKYHINGVADILGIMKNKFICIEVKTAKGRLSPAQKTFLKEVSDLGAIAFVARSVDDVKDKLEKECLL